MAAAVLSGDASGDDPLVVFLSGDDISAKEIVSMLINDASFIPHDLGDSSQPALHEPRGPLYTRTFTRSGADEFLTEIRSAAAGR